MTDLIRTPPSILGAFLRGAGLIAGGMVGPLGVMSWKLEHRDARVWLIAGGIVGVVALLGGAVWAVPAVLYRIGYDHVVEEGWPPPRRRWFRR